MTEAQVLDLLDQMRELVQVMRRMEERLARIEITLTNSLMIPRPDGDIDMANPLKLTWPIR